MQSIVFQKTDVEMPKLITLSHEFLRSFCRNNRENQIRLHAFITTDADESTKEGMFQVLVKYYFQIQIHQISTKVFVFYLRKKF